MQVSTILEEINHLTLDKKLFIVEETIKSIKKNEVFHQMSEAVNELYEDYVSDKELTAFTLLDIEKFYETK